MSMWKEYSLAHIRHDRGGSCTIMAASFIAALFLSFLCCLFYNFWLDGAENGSGEVPMALLLFYLIVIVIVCISLILVIHNSFAVTMQDRVRQFGIFSSIGATPGQIRICLLQEAFLLSVCPVIAGVLGGLFGSFLTVRAMGRFAEDLAGGRNMEFALHPALLAGVLAISFLTVLVSAFIPAGKLSALTPLEAIRGAEEFYLVKKKRPGLLAAVFGIEGELAGNALYAQRKALRTTTLSMTFAFLGFMLMESFFTLSRVSTEHTYFERYQDVWDVYGTVKDTEIGAFVLTEEMHGLPGAENAVVYQKAQAFCLIPGQDLSPELLAKGGPWPPAGTLLPGGEDVYRIEATLVILDDESFADYCGQIGVAPRFDGTILYNRIWDSRDSNFRYPTYLPYIREGIGEILLESDPGAAGLSQESIAAGQGREGIRLPVLACSGTPPVLREEYKDHVLVQFVPLSLWQKLSGQAGTAENDLFVRVLAQDRESLEALEELEADMAEILWAHYQIESENRIQEKRDNDRMIWGYKMILSGLCALFALIGIAGMFSNTLSFLNKRKREFARYMSVGLGPEGVRRLLCMEAVTLIGRPLLLTMLLTAGAAAFMIKISYLDPWEFLEALPVGQILAFVAVVLGFTALAYYLGGRKILGLDLKEALGDDTMLR